MSKSMSKQHLLRIKNISQLVQVSNTFQKYKIGDDMKNVNISENMTIIVNKEGKIEDIGNSDEMEKKYLEHTFEQEIDAKGKSVIPGFIDCHTHPVWSGDRCHEFAMKLNGATYMEIHKQGGGIGFTVNHTRESSEEELLELLIPRLNQMMRSGTTLVEAKSGYGLNCETEMKMLKVIEKAKKIHPIEIVSTFLAHSIPKDSTIEKYTENVISEQIPKLKELMDKKELFPELIDVFCEKGVFGIKESKAILEEGKKLGLKINFHGDELNPIKGAQLASELEAIGISHLEKIDKEGIKAIAKSKTSGVLLPTTGYILRLEQAPAREMISKNVIISLASDFNPNAPCTSIPFVMHLGCVQLRMTMEESLVATTLNAAYSLGKSETHGSIEIGKFADFIILNNKLWQHIIYELTSDSIIDKVIKFGKVIFQNEKK
ncbi:imidazolonepropionase [Anaeramoeba ignava]|uniref:Probable imidazolonepropionase n=1 Tax=Anaeramoeba ignava TaxID=1746090 RepID=A0A9Q0LEU8_ANAIG|nr:imidazolonepropionase [Anaeramoeba ignava]